ncbi:LytR/AlgR family response regulator transcription factor [Marilutibacter chinensis]|uniref:LytTR family DNA-binding domain-containing protein n=1 Tax=Marilutibacter chinensis TaxID=2912247 RepID=A0ABS9HQN1_9GAMM|nr:LytTR family DNA-binding domain-containing protein [Lysobacter chinensis]MCF7221245.1 LytTR family DNA-binding domain-containing protein [Lysobacter chinensis]MCF7223014.1 LytTR family DNA-binding domain-containing protein [Lysobacter chinensis]
MRDPSTEAPTVLVAEDEAPQRAALLAMLLETWPELGRVQACEDGVEALQAVAAQRPQVAFLDIRMPGVSGLDVARAVVAYGGQVVFTTAFDEYAIGAFEAGALDYLLKPVQPASLARAVARVRERLAQPDRAALRERVDALEARLRPTDGRLVRWISASIGDSVRMIGIDEVLFFQAQDKYVRVVSDDNEAVIRTPLKELLAGLDPDAFWQVHRGVIVRVAAIDCVHKDELGKWRLHLRGRDEALPVSAAFLHRFRGM